MTFGRPSRGRAKVGRGCIRLVVLVSPFVVLLMAASPAAADNCDVRINPEDCQNTAWTVGTVAAVAASVTAVAVAIGFTGVTAAGASTAGGPSGAAGGVGTAPATPATGPTEQVVVSGPEAVDILARGGAPTIVRGGTTYLVPPIDGGGDVVGIAHTTTRLPDGTEVVGPDDIAIVQEIPARAGPQTIVEGPSAVSSMIDQGFPTVRDPVTGIEHVRVPPNLIHGNVTGIAYGGTTMVAGVEVIDPNTHVVVIEAGPRGTPSTTGPTGGPTTAPPGGTGTLPGGPTTGGGAGGAPGGTTPPPPTTQPPRQVPPGPGSTPPAVPPGVRTVPPPPPPTPGSQPPVTQPPGAGPGQPQSPPATSPTPPVPTGPPRVPTDPGQLESSLTQPGATVLTPSNAAGLVPDLVNPDGTLRVPSTAPSWARALDGARLPPIQIEGGAVRMDLGVAGGEVRLSVRDGRLVGRADGTGLAMMEDLNGPVQSRLDRLNDRIAAAGLEVKDVTADGGEIRIVTGAP